MVLTKGQCGGTAFFINYSCVIFKYPVRQASTFLLFLFVSLNGILLVEMLYYVVNLCSFG